MKTLLINTGQYMLAEVDYPLNTFQPLGIAYIADVLLKKRYEVAILDILAEGYDREETRGKYKYVGLPRQEIKKRIKTFSPDIVGVTVPFTAQAKAGHEMAKIVKSINEEIKVVMGGSYPTTHAETILKRDKNVDFVVRGEGEVTFLELIQKIEKGIKKFDKIKGLAFRRGRGVKATRSRPPLMNLDDYHVAWQLLPMEKYFEAAYRVRSSRSISTFGKRWATIFTSRGCPYHCTFCVGHEVMGRKWRPRSVKNVIGEMEYLIDHYQIEHFDIEDDNFTLDKKRAKAICDEIIKKKWDIQWSTPNGIRADTVDEELIKKMAQSGCVRTIVAPESGNQWVVNHLMKKNLDLNKVKQVVKWCRKYKILVDVFFLIGVPGENEEQINDTIKLAKELRRLGAAECGFGVAVPHKGTEIHRIAKEEGWLLDLTKENLTEGLMIGKPMIETPWLPATRVKALLKKGLKTNPLIPAYRLRLAATIALKTPRRFWQLAVSDFKKRLGIKEGILGT